MAIIGFNDGFFKKNSIHIEFIKHKSKQQIELFGIIL